MEKIRLGDVVEISNGFAFKSKNYTNNGIRIIRIANVQKGYIEDTSPVFYPKNSKGIERYMLKKDDLLVSLTGNVGRVAILNEKFLPAALNQRVACLRVKTNKITKDYLFHFLNSNYFEQQCISASKGVAQKNISTKWLRTCEIPLYPKEKQFKIGEILGKLRNIKEAKMQEIEQLNEMVKARFVEMFGTYPGNEKGWETGTIRDLVTDVHYGSSRKAAKGIEGRYPYLRMNNITYSGELDLTDVKTINIPDKELDKCTVQKGDLLFNRTNSKELVGKTCVYNKDDQMVLAGFIIRVRLNDRALPEFVSTFLNTDFSKNMLANMCKTAIGQANINAQEMQNIGIYIPPTSLQKEFCSFKSDVNKSKFALINDIL